MLSLGAALPVTVAAFIASCGGVTATPGDAGTDAASPSSSSDASSDATSSSSSGGGSSSGSVGDDGGVQQIVDSTDAGPLGSTACKACMADDCQSLASACASSVLQEEDAAVPVCAIYFACVYDVLLQSLPVSDAALLNAKTECGGATLPVVPEVAAGNRLVDCVVSSCAAQCLGQ